MQQMVWKTMLNAVIFVIVAHVATAGFLAKDCCMMYVRGE